MKIKNIIQNALKAFSTTPGKTFFNIIGSAATLRRKTAESDPAGAYAGWVYAAISKRAKRIGAIELELYQMKKNDDLEELNDHEILALLNRANPIQSKYQFFYTIELMLCIWGSAPIYKDRLEGTKVRYLWPLRPDLMKAITNNDGKIISYEYRVSGKVQTLKAEDIININEPSPLSLTQGHSPTLAAGLEIDADMSAAIWNKHLIDNFAEPGGVLTTDQKLSDAEFERLQKVWNARHQGATNAGRWALLEKGLKAEAVGKGPKDMDLVESRRFHRNAITAILGVPMSLLTSEDVNLANAEAGERIFAKDTVEPQMKLIVGCLNEFMVPEFGDNLWIDFESPVASDVTKDVAIAVAGEGRWMTVNECRDLFNLEPIEGGDAIFKPLGIVPQLGDGSEAWKNTPQNAPLKYERIDVDRVPKRKYTHIIRSIKARSFTSRKTQAGLRSKIMKAIDRQTTGGGQVVRLKVVSVKDKKEHDERLLAERKEFLRKLPQTQKLYKKRFSAYFEGQKKEVMDNIDALGLPKGRFGKTPAKSTADRWINKILFDGKNADDTILELSGTLYDENIREGAEDIAKLLGLNPSDVLASPFVIDFVKDRSFNMLKVNENTREELKKTLREGIALGEDLGEVRGRVTDVYAQAEGFRAETIARTEVGAAQNFGRLAEMEGQKVEKKVWITTYSNSRDAHIAADGQVVGVHEHFDVGGERLMYPGDPEGSPGNVINCQCSASPTLKD